MTATSISEEWRNPLLAGKSYIEFARRRAEGGVGLLIAHPFYVDPSGSHPASIRERHAELAAAVRSAGAVLIVQLVHFGATFRRTDGDVRRSALWGFGHTCTPEGEAVHRMTHGEIEQLLFGYREAARLVAEAGCDGVELHGVTATSYSSP